MSSEVVRAATSAEVVGAATSRIESVGLDAVTARHRGAALAKEMIRVNHDGAHATVEAVQGCLTALGTALSERGLTVDAAGARRAAESACR
jgi:aspartate aminotransferase-like enzyme